MLCPKTVLSGIFRKDAILMQHWSGSGAVMDKNNFSKSLFPLTWGIVCAFPVGLTSTGLVMVNYLSESELNPLRCLSFLSRKTKYRSLSFRRRMPQNSFPLYNLMLGNTAKSHYSMKTRLKKCLI